jgi:polar amino acid transport system substrate-binding protein
MMRRSFALCLLMSVFACKAIAGPLVHIAFGESLEPYVMASNNSGIEVEIVRAAFLARGYQIEPEYFSQPRLPMALEKSDIDAVATLGEQSGIKAGYSDVYISYEDEAITLADRHLTLKSPRDLEHLSVLAFSHARSYLGPEFADMARHNPRYSETADQLDQARQLYHGLVDVVIADRRIFLWMSRMQTQQFKEKTLPVDEHRLFPPTAYRLACRTPQLCATFNRGLKDIQANGQYQKILDQYR